MKLVDVGIKVRCDIPNCKNMAKYKLVKTGFLKNAGLLLCKDCLNEIYSTIGVNVVPKSPSNMLNKKISNKKITGDVDEK